MPAHQFTPTGCCEIIVTQQRQHGIKSKGEESSPAGFPCTHMRSASPSMGPSLPRQHNDSSRNQKAVATHTTDSLLLAPTSVAFQNGMKTFQSWRVPQEGGAMWLFTFKLTTLEAITSECIGTYRDTCPEVILHHSTPYRSTTWCF